MSEFSPYRSRRNNKGSTGGGECSTPMPTSPIDHIQFEPIGIFYDWTGQTAQLKSDLIFSNPLKPLLAKLRKNSIAEGYSIIPGSSVRSELSLQSNSVERKNPSWSALGLSWPGINTALWWLCTFLSFFFCFCSTLPVLGNLRHLFLSFY